MNSLHESIARRRAAALRTNELGSAAESEKFSCVVYGSRPGLVLARWQAESWVFPWSHLQWARLSSTDDADELLLSFPHHQAVVLGDGLRGLVDAIAEFRVVALRNLPAEYRVHLVEDEPRVAKIDMRETAQA
jgi:hypothetical protein